MVFLIERWDAFTSSHPSMQVFYEKFEIYTKILVALSLTAADAPRQFSPLLCQFRLPMTYIIERLMYNNMDLLMFFLIIFSDSTLCGGGDVGPRSASLLRPSSCTCGVGIGYRYNAGNRSLLLNMKGCHWPYFWMQMTCCSYPLLLQPMPSLMHVHSQSLTPPPTWSVQPLIVPAIIPPWNWNGYSPKILVHSTIQLSVVFSSIHCLYLPRWTVCVPEWVQVGLWGAIRRLRKACNHSHPQTSSVYLEVRSL